MGLSVSRWRLAEGAARLRPAARAAIGGLRSAAGRPARVAGLHAGQRREPGSLGRAVERSVLPRAARPEFAIGRNRRLRRAGAGDRDGLSPCPTPALLGAQDAQHFGEGPAARRSAGQGRGSENLLGEERRNCATRLRTISVSLALALSRHGSATGTRSARAAALLRSAATLVAESAHHQCHRTLLRRGPPPDAAHGRLHQRRKRGPNHLCDFQSFQPGLENPHPQPIYTSSLTSPLAVTHARADCSGCRLAAPSASLLFSRISRFRCRGQEMVWPTRSKFSYLCSARCSPLSTR